jgi:hypothetical protein
MGQKLSSYKVIENCVKIHGNTYDYSEINFVNTQEKITIICKEHGPFKQRYHDHINGVGCPFCSGNGKLNTEMFIKKAKIIHGDTYDYSETIYEKTEKEVDITCKTHGKFEQTPHQHLAGKGCMKCGREKTVKSHLNNHKSFLEKANKLHNFKYDYIDEYTHQLIKIKIECKEHGVFFQTPKDHLSGCGCKICGRLYKGKIKTKDEFIYKSNLVHDFKYDYSKLMFRYMTDKSIIVCPEHGEFKQNLIAHLSGCGCPNCSISKGEKEILRFLKNKNIKFIPQKYFENCKHERYLYFDFYLPEHNLCIEYDGEQHFKSIKHFGGEQSLNKIKIRDKIKEEFCKTNSIGLFRIRFDENVKERLLVLFGN